MMPQIEAPRLFARSGLVSNSPTGTAIDSPLIELLAALVLGALAGLILGFIITNVLRFVSIMVGRHIGGHAWTLYATLLGALLFGILSLTDAD